MVTREDLANEAEYVDIKLDVSMECQQYGKVRSVVIPRVRDGYPAASECLIFVEFETVDGAVAAAKVLNGRKFAENTVVVSYVSTSRIVVLRLSLWVRGSISAFSCDVSLRSCSRAYFSILLFLLHSSAKGTLPRNTFHKRDRSLTVQAAMVDSLSLLAPSFD